MKTPAEGDDLVRLWLEVGNMARLEQALLDGHGHSLRRKSSRIPRIRKFLRRVPHYQARIYLIHCAAFQGDLKSVRGLMDRKAWGIARDPSGRTPLHKAIMSNQVHVVRYLVSRFRSSIEAKDHRGRTPLMYAAALAGHSSDTDAYDTLLESGANVATTDKLGRSVDYYRNNAQEFWFHLEDAISWHPWIEHWANKNFYDMPESPPVRGQIRQMIHTQDFESMEWLVVMGFGDRLVGETSANEDVFRFLVDVPNVLNTIAMLHLAARMGDLEATANLLLSPQMAFSRDAHGACALHKGVLFNHMPVVRHILKHFPDTIHAKDVVGRTPLHYAAGMEDTGLIYRILTQQGADEAITDKHGRTGKHYLYSPEDLNASLLRENTTEMMASRRREVKAAVPLQNGLYVHSSPPKVLQLNSSTIRKWLRSGDTEKLEQVVLEGQGNKLMGEHVTDQRVRSFLKTVPGYMAKIEMLHEAVAKGNLRETQSLLDRRKLASSKDQSGQGLLHKAVSNSHKSIAEWMVKKYPETITVKDNDGRLPVHYCGSCKEPEEMLSILVEAGADPTVADARGKSAEHYLEHPEELDMDFERSITKSRIRGAASKNASFKDSSQISAGSTGSNASRSGRNISRANIRIWIHDRDIAKLENIVWEGHGDKLLLETTNNPRVKKFLDNVPHLLLKIKEIHQSAVEGDLEHLVSLKKRMRNVNELFYSKDRNGYNPLHKAAALGHTDVVDYLTRIAEPSLHLQDKEGRLPLHVSGASHRQAPRIYDMLVSSGSDESVLDYRGKTAQYYRLHPNELDLRHIREIPDAPRVSGELEGWDRGNRGNKSPEQEEEPEEPEPPMPPRSPTPLSFRNVTNDQIDRWVKNGSVSRLEQLVIEGRGDKLQGKTSWNEDVRHFLNTVPNLMNKVISVHRAAQLGDLDELRALIEADPRMAKARDENGAIPLHQAALYGQTGAIKYLIDVYPDGVTAQDSDRRTPLHYAAMFKDMEVARRNYVVLLNAGAEEAIVDLHGHDAGHYFPQGEPEAEHEDSGLESGISSSGGQEEVQDEGHDEGQVDDDVDRDEAIVAMQNRDLDRMVDMVLDGQGDRLVGLQSNDPEVQAFLDNVPAYMAKIDALHIAATRGNLRELQTLLDRKQLGRGRDHLGATPLHKAVLYGHTEVSRYLAGQCSDTLNLQDHKGRGPLHYAATVRDGGHIFKILVNAGCDPNLKDEKGNTPGYYLRNKNELTRDDLLEEFEGTRRKPKVERWQRPPTEEDKGKLITTNEFPMLWNEEGQYLSSVLGDALIKGLTEVSHTRPSDPIAYLANFLHSYAKQKSVTAVEIPAPIPEMQSEEDFFEEGPTSTEVEDAPDPEVQEAAPTEAELNNEVEAMAMEEAEIGPQEAEAEDAQPSSQDDDVVVPEPQEQESVMEDRDEHGQSVLHFTSARPHAANSIYQILNEAEPTLAYRDERYRTPRDVALEAGRPENAAAIDSWILSLAAQGRTERLQELVLQGYDHIIDLEDNAGHHIVEITEQHSQDKAARFLRSISGFEEKRDWLHKAVRLGSLDHVKDALDNKDDRMESLCRALAAAKNHWGRHALHIAVLCEEVAIAEFLANRFSETLRIGDNLERTALHYAMGVDKVESLAKILIKAGSRRVIKDLKGRQPSYYFMNKEDIIRLQREEDSLKS